MCFKCPKYDQELKKKSIECKKYKSDFTSTLLYKSRAVM